MIFAKTIFLKDFNDFLFENRGFHNYPLPRHGIYLSISFLKVTSNNKPSIPITKIVIQITSYWKYFLATFSTKPIPVVPAKNSAATNVPQHIPIATLTPVKISGNEFGNITYLKICHLEAPSECEA